MLQPWHGMAGMAQRDMRQFMFLAFRMGQVYTPPAFATCLCTCTHAPACTCHHTCHTRLGWAALLHCVADFVHCTALPAFLHLLPALPAACCTTLCTPPTCLLHFTLDRISCVLHCCATALPATARHAAACTALPACTIFTCTILFTTCIIWDFLGPAPPLPLPLPACRFFSHACHLAFFSHLHVHGCRSACGAHICMHCLHTFFTTCTHPYMPFLPTCCSLCIFCRSFPTPSAGFHTHRAACHTRTLHTWFYLHIHCHIHTRILFTSACRILPTCLCRFTINFLSFLYLYRTLPPRSVTTTTQFPTTATCITIPFCCTTCLWDCTHC